MGRIIQLLRWVLPISAAILLANHFTPWLYRQLPNDYSRTSLIIEALADTKASPESILFGNSVLMSGIDARALRVKTNSGLIYNFSSSGQTLSESQLYYSQVPKSVKQVFQFARVDELMQPPAVLQEAVLRNFRLFNHQAECCEFKVPEEYVKFQQESDWRVRFEARTIITNTFNRNLREVFRKDLDIQRAEADLFFPNIYAGRPLPVYNFNVTHNNPNPAISMFNFNSETLARLSAASQAFKRRGVQFTLVICPMNPDLTGFDAQFRAQARSKIVQMQEIRIVSLFDALMPIDFVDHWHISRAGAQKMTLAFAEKMQATP